MKGPKEELYRTISYILDLFGTTQEWYPLHAIDFVKLMPHRIFLEYLPFNNLSIGAIMVRGPITGIAVNKNKDPCDQNFDIAHELMHFWLHRDSSALSIDYPAKSQDRIKEWQANEGAAQLLVPHWDFIPRFLSKVSLVEENFEPVENLYTDLANYYGVNPIVT